jgi:tetratricopeptide (TPR) repeat protein
VGQYGPALGPAAWLASSVTVLAVLALTAWSVFAGRLAQPSATTVAGEGIPIPNRHTIEVAQEIDAFPIVARNFPDAASQHIAAQYAGLSVSDEAAAIRLFDQQWDALDVATSDRQHVQSFRDAILSDAPFSVSPSGLETLDNFNPAAVPVLQTMTRNKVNADRLNNAALLLFLAGVARSEMAQPDGQADLVRRGKWLLRATAQVFPDARPAHLNAAFAAGNNLAECMPLLGTLAPAQDMALSWLASHPEDATARALLAELELNDVDQLLASPSYTDSLKVGGLGTALQALEPLRHQPATAGLGAALIGDAYVAAATDLQQQAPGLARSYALSAIGSYREALVGGVDAAVLDGMSAAYDLVGDRANALTAAQQAVAFGPASVESFLRLAIVRMELADFTGAKAAAAKALGLVVAPVPPVSGVWYGVVARSTTFSDRPMVPVPGSLSDDARTGCGGGGFEVLRDPVPSTDDPGWRSALSFRSLSAPLTLALMAAGAQSDPTSAQRDLALWIKRFGVSADESTITGERAMAAAVDAASRPAAPPDSGALMDAASLLRKVADASGQSALFSRAADLCHGLIFLDLTDSTAARCEGEAAYHAGALPRAVVALDEAQAGNRNPVPQIERAYIIWRLGQRPTAEGLFQRARDAASDETGTDTGRSLNFVTASLLLGELLLDEGKPQQALAPLHDAAHAAADLIGDRVTLYREERTRPPIKSPFETASIDVDMGLLEHADNEHGLALLWSLQPGQERPPDCVQHQSTCDQARSDFQSALAIDPTDSLALMNVGWVDRLSGRLQEARTALAASAGSDPSNYAVLNDLGFLLAKAGAHAQAESALRRALALEPGDDLAAWNLGVDLLSGGPFGIVRGEAYLARAARLEPELRDGAPAYRGDERVYRQFYGSVLNAIPRDAIDSQFAGGIAVTGAVGAATALLIATGTDVEEWLTELLAERELPLIGPWLKRRRAKNAMSAPGPMRQRLAAALRWLLTAGVLAAVAAWPAWQQPGTARVSTVVLMLAAVLLALVAHEAALLVAAGAAKARLRPVWPGRAILVTLGTMPFGVADGPFPGHTPLRGEPFKRMRWVLLAGIAANLLLATFFYFLYRIDFVPALRLFAEAQIGAAAFASVPLTPLDASIFRGKRAAALVLLPFTVAAVVGGLAFKTGLL